MTGGSSLSSQVASVALVNLERSFDKPYFSEVIRRISTNNPTPIWPQMPYDSKTVSTPLDSSAMLKPQ